MLTFSRTLIAWRKEIRSLKATNNNFVISPKILPDSPFDLLEEFLKFENGIQADVDKFNLLVYTS